MKDVFLIIIGFALGIAVFFVLVTHISQISDIINTISIFVNIGIGVFVAYFVQNSLTNNRYVKDYHINLITTISNDYEVFLKEIRNGKLNKAEILRDFKYFSMRFTALDNILKVYFKSSNAQNLQLLNRGMHQIITGSLEFNSTVTNSKVKLRFGTLDNMIIKHNDLTNLITNHVITINSK